MQWLVACVRLLTVPSVGSVACYLLAGQSNGRQVPRYIGINGYCFVLFRICCYGSPVGPDSLPPGVISRVMAFQTMSGTIGSPTLNLAVVYGRDWRQELSMLHVLHGRCPSQLKGGASFTPSHPLLLCCSHVKTAIAPCSRAWVRLVSHDLQGGRGQHRTRRNAKRVKAPTQNQCQEIDSTLRKLKSA